LAGPEVVELADQPQVAQINTQVLVGFGDRLSRVVQLGDVELDAGLILMAQQQRVAGTRPRRRGAHDLPILSQI
jgi:hypothetical protein